MILQANILISSDKNHILVHELSSLPQVSVTFSNFVHVIAFVSCSSFLFRVYKSQSYSINLSPFITKVVGTVN